ncbi:hypothetical protein PR048_009879 [Dryococelus australis]|uniref:Uncharacterized protein n=1 Tax=Dryococelus australis TaxID=614101 RepID=A0ABQ9I146_9NEOP|nr:hypothetical protein PR048_009879 [Dryococelus australis]
MQMRVIQIVNQNGMVGTTRIAVMGVTILSIKGLYQEGEFGNFAKDRLEFQLSSPRHSQSTGFAEKSIHLAKRLLHKCSEISTDYREALRAFCNTPRPDLGASPSELLNSRLVQTRVPVTGEKL